MMPLWIKHAAGVGMDDEMMDGPASDQVLDGFSPAFNYVDMYEFLVEIVLKLITALSKETS